MKKNKSFLLVVWFLLFSLGSSLVASSLAICDFDANTPISKIDVRSDSFSVSQIKIEKTVAGDDFNTDGCAQGFCHLGHCSSILFPTQSHFSFPSEFQNEFVLSSKMPLERFLDGPFQPPKNA